MIIIMKKEASVKEVSNVLNSIEEAGCRAHADDTTGKTIIGVLTCGLSPVVEHFKKMPGVNSVLDFDKPYKLASKEFHPLDTIIKVGDAQFGTRQFTVIAGPCSVEGKEQIIEIAQSVKKSGAHVLRGGAYKPRSSPYSFQGLGEEGLLYLKEAGQIVGLPIITEILNPRHIEFCAEHADILQVGMRNMQNYELLKELGQAGRPIFLKRGFAARIEDLLLSAEYLLSSGCDQVILCERGIRTFETSTRNTLDIAAVPVLKKLTHLPVIVDPSHACGYSEYVPALTAAAVAVGAAGVMLEVHSDPLNAKSDGQQSLNCNQFAKLMKTLAPLAKVCGKTL